MLSRYHVLQNYYRRVTSKTNAWKKDPGRNQIFRYKVTPFREKRKDKNLERDRPRYKIVDDAQKNASWSPHDWTGIVWVKN